MKRRHLLAGAAALPFAGVGLGVESSYSYATDAADDPAIEAVRHWLAANLDERAPAYGDSDLPDEDPQQEALYQEERRLWQEMIDTPPQTAAGLALMLAATLYRIEAGAAGCHFHGPDTWHHDGAEGVYSILPALWRSPAAAELFRLLPADDIAAREAERERSAEAFDKALAEAEKRPYDPTWGEVQGATIAAEAMGKPLSEDEAVALLRAHGRREAA